ncbi:glucose 1-dehydrogenase [Embleya sp. NPDC050493]|uniref:glucose 1-dehydrogenase n=1 Tax=Embleya sp. NPDC050493 TaxID=3363989 RepID=UPI00378FBC30
MRKRVVRTVPVPPARRGGIEEQGHFVGRSMDVGVGRDVGRLAGKVALVTGAARGQGAAHACRFAAEGAKVVLADVLDEDGASLAAEIGADAVYTRLDVRDEDDWAAAVRLAGERFGTLDVLVNNAGVNHFAPILDTTTADFMRVVEINLLGCFLGIRTAAPAIVAAGGGSIVNVSSINGLVGAAHTSAYVATKFAIRGLTKSAAIELGPLGVRVNSIHPGAIDTDMARAGLELARQHGLDPMAKLPLGRVGTVEEAANLALFLASEESSYSTGSEFVFDGGWTAGPGS